MERELYHHGIKGQRWGVRRYQNPDGTLTDAGKRRYGDSVSDGKSKAESSRKKTAAKVAAGTAIVAGTVLAAYMLQKYGNKDLSAVANKASAGKEIVDGLLKTTSIASTPVHQLPTPKVEPKQVLERVAKSASTTSTSISKVSTSKVEPKKVLEKAAKSVSAASASAGKVSASKPAFDTSSGYNFESLMRQNDDLLKKMLAGLA